MSGQAEEPAVVLIPGPDISGRWVPQIRVLQQTFSFGGVCDSETEAQWWCRQMEFALRRAGCRVSGEPQGGKCRWVEDGDGVWETSCGEAFTFIDGGPEENKAKWCHYCGRAIVPNKFEFEPEEDNDQTDC